MVVVNLSGGKDSTFMLLRMLELGMRVDLIVYADVGEMAEFEYMYEYIKRIEQYIGRRILTVRSEIYTARSIFYGYPTRGNHMDEIRGFPPTIGVGCRYRSWLKVDPLNAASGKGNDVYIGIAADEEHRSRCKEYTKGSNNYHFPLVDWGYTEQMCLDGLKERGLYNELYGFFDRLGCWWCPKQPINSLRMLRKHFNDKWQMLMQMEADQGRPFKHKYPAIELDRRFWQEEAGLYVPRRRKAG